MLRMNFRIENNKITDFNIGYQFAFGQEPPNNPLFYGCGGGSYLKIGQNDLTRVDLPYSLVYPWLSTTAAVNLAGGALPTITVPSAVTADDLTGSLVETFAAGSLADIENHTFDVGSNLTGYIQITASAEIVHNSSINNGNWFNLKITSNEAQAVTKFWQDQLVLPTNATWRILEQERSWSGAVMSKRCMLETVGSGFTTIPANATFAMKLYFKID